MSSIISFLFGPTYNKVLKDVFWGLSVILLSSTSHYGFSLFHSALRDQPARRLWDKPSSVFSRERDGRRITSHSNLELHFNKKQLCNKNILNNFGKNFPYAKPRC